MLRLLRAPSLAVLLAAFEPGCNKRHVAAPVPPTPAPAETVAPQTPSTLAPSPAPSPPAQTPQPQSPPQSPPASTQRRPTRPSEPGNPGQPNQAPRLGDILTPEQERQFNSEIDQSLARTQSSLEAIGNRKLTTEQQGVVAQIRSFVQQAQTTRKSNLPAARSLAERADVLARDLAGSLR